LTALQRFPGFNELVIEETQIGDAGIAKLQALRSLEWLRVANRRVTEGGAKRLNPALPTCVIQLK
jgi:hypothetical protein